VSHYLANSLGVADYLVTRERVRRQAITIVHNGLRDRVQEGAFLKRSQLGLRESDFVLLSVAWLKPHKSLDFLIRSVARLRHECDRMKLLLVGDGPEEDKLRAMAGELRIADAVVFAGRHADTHCFARLADVAVSASQREGMSNSSMEALMMGLPVVACEEAGGNRDIVCHGMNGYLYPFRDENAFCEAIVTLYGDPAARAGMGEAGRQRFLTHFTMAAQVRGFLDLYQRILGAG
jgi:glycosyltransferase involved in cell wall biosynthesis